MTVKVQVDEAYRTSNFEAEGIKRVARINRVAEYKGINRVAEYKMHLSRVKRRMIAAIQTTRVKWAVRCINSARPREQQTGREERR